MKRCYILKKTNTAKGSIGIDYLDETSELKASYTRRKTGGEIKQIQSQVVENLDAIEYISKEESGQVNASGFLRDMLLTKGGLSPNAMSNEERKSKISSAIRKHINIYGRYRGACAHKLVLSMDAKLHGKIKVAGLSPDKVLISHMKKVMRDFKNKFYPGDRIGYAYGLHHDTDHLHVHIYLVNRTEKGKHVAYSRPLKGKFDPKPRKNQMGFCDERVNKIGSDFWKKLDREEVIKESNLQAIRAAKLDRMQMITENDMLALSLQNKYKTLMAMENKIINKYIPPTFKIAKMAGLSFHLARGLGAGRIKAFREKRELKKQYFALKGKYFYDLAIHKNKEKQITSIDNRIQSQEFSSLKLNNIFTVQQENKYNKSDIGSINNRIIVNGLNDHAVAVSKKKGVGITLLKGVY